MHPDIWRAFQRLRSLRAEAPPLVAHPRAESAPVSFQQERLWYLDQANPGGSAYHLPVAFRLTGPLDWRALRLALEALEHRHESLRTSFSSSRGQVVQRVRAPGAFVFPTVSLRDEVSTLEEREVAMREALIQEAWRAFDLQRDTLFRAVLFVLDAQEHVLLLGFHRIICDDESLDLLFRDLSELYAAFQQGLASPLSAKPIQCADHARWQREWIRGTCHEELRAYWRERLKDRLQGPRLTACPRTANAAASSTRELGRRSLHFAPELSRAVLQFAREAGATVHMVLLAAFHLLLHRYAGGQEHHFVCSPIANRPQTETERLVGYFVNLMVLPADLRGDPSFRRLLEQVREVLVGALPHQDLPVQLMDAIDLGGEPLSQVLFSFDNTPRHPFQLANLRITPLEFEGGTCDFDLFLAIHEEDGVISGMLEYSRNSFQLREAARLLEDFETVLRQAIAAPERALSSFLPGRARREASSLTPAARALARSARLGAPRVSEDVISALGTAAPEERRKLMRDYLHGTVVQVALGGQPPDAPIQSLQELALDSLRLIELTGRIRTELSVDMPVSRFFDAMNVEVLADELIARWLRSRTPEPRPPASVHQRREHLTP
ncbi:condensation domain-containing protein [Myxococcus stipitatus]|uniref:condensation domain-containing protein n=1 Tax=Myxococcus stipitatus TaxID=83455 RepID=UPI0030D19CF9